MSTVDRRRKKDAHRMADQVVDRILQLPATIVLELRGIANELEQPRLARTRRLDMARRLRIYSDYVGEMTAALQGAADAAETRS